MKILFMNIKRRFIYTVTLISFVLFLFSYNMYGKRRMQSISKKNYNKEGKLKQNNDFDMLIFDDVYDQEMHALGVSKAHKRPSKLTEYYDGLGKHSYIGVQKSKKKDVEKSVKNSSIKKSSVASIAQLDDDDIDGFDVDFFRELDFELDDEDLELRDLFSGDDEYYF